MKILIQINGSYIHLDNLQSDNLNASDHGVKSVEDYESNNLNASDREVKLSDDNDGYLKLGKNILPGAETVRIQLYYESLCPDSITFNVRHLADVVFMLYKYIDIQTYPFGNAEIIIDHDGKIDFKCQHGPKECYGNKLHACAIDKLQHTTALIYNICLMNSTSSVGSDDKSADRCGKLMNIDSEPIKECAKGARGMELLAQYGIESWKAHYIYVPYALINGKVYDSKSNDLITAACAAFTNPPLPCTKS